MLTIKRTTQFKRDFRREKRGRYGANLYRLLNDTIELLCIDSTLPERLHDHPLSGKFKGFRDCHIKPDLVLVYRKTNYEILELIRLGSHSELDI